MAQINLLRHNPTPQQTLSSISSVVVKLLSVLILGLVAYYGYLWFQIGSQEKRARTLEAEITSVNSSVARMPDLDEVALRQSQLREFEGLLSKHIYWSSLLPKLAEATTKSTMFTSVKALSDGTLTVSALVPNMAELDKLLQVFNRKDVSENFYNVRIGSVGRELAGEVLGLKVDLHFEYAPNLLQYNQQYSAKK